MYRILNKLFGWDYIYWENSADSGIARVHVLPNGTPYYWQYKSIKYMQTLPNKRSTHRVIWLTCKPEKYL